MNMNKYIGKKAFITKEGEYFGKSVKIQQVVDDSLILVSCEWLTPNNLMEIDCRFLTISLD